MANCVNYNCDDFPDFELNVNCKKGYPGGANKLVLFDCDHQVTDFENGTQILAEIAAGRAVLIENLKIRVNKGSPVTVESPVDCAPDVVTDYTRTGSVFDSNISATNDTGWETLLSGRTVGALLFYNCGEGDDARSTLIDAEISFSGDKVFPGANEFQRYEIDFTWKGLYTMAKTINTPVGVF